MIKIGQRGQERGAQAVDRAWESASAPPPGEQQVCLSEHKHSLVWQPRGDRGQSAVTSGIGALTSWVLRKQILPDQETA